MRRPLVDYNQKRSLFLIRVGWRDWKNESNFKLRKYNFLRFVVDMFTIFYKNQQILSEVYLYRVAEEATLYKYACSPLPKVSGK